MFFHCLQVMYRRHRNNDMYTITTNKTTVELTLSPNDNYVVQIKSLSEGGLGEGSEPIHIHQLSKSCFSFSLSDILHKLLIAIQLSTKHRIISHFPLHPMIIDFFPSFFVLRWSFRPFQKFTFGSPSISVSPLLFIVDSLAKRHVKQHPFFLL